MLVLKVQKFKLKFIRVRCNGKKSNRRLAEVLFLAGCFLFVEKIGFYSPLTETLARLNSIHRHHPISMMMFAPLIRACFISIHGQFGMISDPLNPIL